LLRGGGKGGRKDDFQIGGNKHTLTYLEVVHERPETGKLLPNKEMPEVESGLATERKMGRLPRFLGWT
jgi:hypothetical protein